MASTETIPTSRKQGRRVKESTKAQAENELSDAQKTVRDLALKIEKANARTRGMQQRAQKWHDDEQEVSSKIKEDSQYAQVMKEIEHIKHELGKLKLDMKHVLKEKRHADIAFKASSSKKSTLSSTVDRINKEIEDLDEEHVLVEIARIEAVKEREAIETQRTEEASRYRTRLEQVKKKVEEIFQHNETTQELQKTLYNINTSENELAQAKETKSTPDLLHTIKENIEATKDELTNIKRDGFDIMTSMDVIRNELKHVREERDRLEKEEEKRYLIVQTLNTKIMKGKAKLEAVTATAEQANTIASNLSLTVDQLKAEAETLKKEKELISKEIENIKLEIPKTESDIELSEKQLEAAMEELSTVKSSECKALENLKNLIDSTVQARELSSLNSSTITITDFEYQYLMEKAGGAEVIADKKVTAARAWVEALKANEKEILMKVEIAQKEIRLLSVGVDVDEEAVTRRKSVDEEVNRLAQNEAKVAASPRKSMYKIGSMTPVKRPRSHLLLSPATRHAIRSASFTKKREKVTLPLSKFLVDENAEMEE